MPKLRRDAHVDAPTGALDDGSVDPPVAGAFVRVFFALYLVLGLGLIALTPPFQSPDAFAHFDRAVGLARGELTSTTSHGTPGDSFPVGVYQTEVVFSGMAAGPDARVAAWQFAYGWRQTWHSAAYFTAFETGGNAPFLYLPQVLGIELGRLVSGRILVSYYGAELINFLTFVGLVWWATSQVPRRLAIALGVFLLLPMVTSLAISVNPDAQLIALSVVFAAAWWRRRRAAMIVETRRRAWDFWSEPSERVAAISLVLMTIEKPPLVLLGLLLPLAERPPRLGRYVARALTLCASAGALYEVWSHLATSPRGHATPLVGVEPVRQLRLVVTHPGHDLAVIVDTLRVNGGLYAREFIAGIGWLDTWFPNWFYLVMGALLLGVTAYANSWTSAWAERTRSLSVLVATALALLFTFYLVDTPLGASTVTGFQGRYLLPLFAPLVAVLGTPALVPAPRGRGARLLDDYGAIGLVSLQLLVAVQFAVTLLHRYWF